jgi:hypothetical protein
VPPNGGGCRKITLAERSGVEGWVAMSQTGEIATHVSLLA